jgi:hypothetical protein
LKQLLLYLLNSIFDEVSIVVLFLECFLNFFKTKALSIDFSTSYEHENLITDSFCEFNVNKVLVVNFKARTQQFTNFIKAIVTPGHAKGDILSRASKLNLSVQHEIIEVFYEKFTQLHIYELSQSVVYFKKLTTRKRYLFL